MGGKHRGRNLKGEQKERRAIPRPVKGRVSHWATIAGRTLTRTPLPDRAYSTLFGKVRVSMPTSKVRQTHAVDMELVNRTRVVWLDKHKADRGVIVYLHGGGYTAGPFVGDWQWLSQQADARECAGLLIDYRYGPDYVHPTALEDSMAALSGVASAGLIGAGDWILAGHHSGAGLALALANEINRETGGRLEEHPVRPAGVVLMNPWLDLELGNFEITETVTHDPVHERKLMQLSAKAYAGRARLDEPRLSPINGDLSGLPPVHLSVGSKDLFLTDSRVVKLQFEREGVDLTYREIPGRISVSPMLRSGADMQRLAREQLVFMERVTA